MADSPVITCPECSKKFNGKGDLSGKRIRCPFCTKVFIVPAGAKEAIKAAPIKIFQDDEDDKNPYGVTELDVAPRCPNCANLMADDKAFVCLHCGYNTLTRELGQTEKSVSHTGNEHFMYLLPGLIAATGVFFIICWLLFFNVVLPAVIEKGSWAEDVFAHESTRLWQVVPLLSTMWALGYYAFNRLVVKPLPPPKVKG